MLSHYSHDSVMQHHGLVHQYAEASDMACIVGSDYTCRCSGAVSHLETDCQVSIRYRESPVRTTESNYPTILKTMHTTASNHSTTFSSDYNWFPCWNYAYADSVALYPVDQPCEIMTLHHWWAGDGGSGTNPVTQEWNGMDASCSV